MTIVGDSIDIDFEARRAVRRQPQLPARRDPSGVLLRRPLPDGARPSGLGRRVRPGDGSRAEGCPSTPALRSRRSGEHGDVEPDHRRRLRRLLAGDPGTGAGSGDDEQRRLRKRPVHVLRDDRRRPGCVPAGRRTVEVHVAMSNTLNTPPRRSSSRTRSGWSGTSSVRGRVAWDVTAAVTASSASSGSSSRCRLPARNDGDCSSRSSGGADGLAVGRS